ncbi:hypothetical protein AB851_17440 [Ralstonia pseudosolanacearum]|nr:hypothetical protein [Ralstonia pseudosolanacearum]OAK89857.1 hypothetical protein AB851_17440 [Ralstonia pseudosolanacearum]QOK89969.1 hypothetical protein HF907_22890 [Ralstonia pseudosolanacearum]
MRKHFPAVDEAVRIWINVADREGLREASLLSLLDEYIPTEPVLVAVHRKVGAALPKAEAIRLIREHLGQGIIRVSDRAFVGFVVVAVNGAATGWRASLPDK